MRSKRIVVGITILVFVVLPFAGLLAESADFGAKGALGRSDLTLEQMLTYAIQDEYLARAEYELIMGEYGNIRPFSNIVTAEVRHIEWVTELFQKYGYTVPEDTAADHVVLPPDLKTAFETGVNAEIDNIAMYESFLKNDSLPADIREIFEELKSGSENHLRAFRNGLNRNK